MRIHRHRMRRPKYDVPKYNVNEQIKTPNVRVVDNESKPLGVLETTKAIDMARAAGFDLVEVSPKADPPVCRFIDYGNFRYQKEKEARKQRSQSKEVEVKGIRLSVRIGQHDLDIRKEQAWKFLERGDKVRIEIMLRGREKAHGDVAKEVMVNFIEDIKQKFAIRVEQAPLRQGGRLTALVARQ